MSEQVRTNLSGVWYNELGSTLTLIADGGGGLSGTYESTVGDATARYILVGRYDADPPLGGAGVSVAWAVTFRNDFSNANSTTGWSGQYFNDGVERILTQWLLTSSTTLSSGWESTNVGHDTFTRNEPWAAEIAKAPALTAHSPHRNNILSRFFHFKF